MYISCKRHNLVNLHLDLRYLIQCTAIIMKHIIHLDSVHTMKYVLAKSASFFSNNLEQYILLRTTEYN